MNTPKRVQLPVAVLVLAVLTGAVPLADVPLIPLYFYVSKHLVARRVHGWYDTVMNVTYSKDLSLAESGEPKP